MLISALLAPAAIASESEKASGWTIVQKGKVSGKSTIDLTAKGVRYDCADAGYGVVAQAPRWQPYLINVKKKVFYPCETGKTTKMAGRLAMAHVALLGVGSNTNWEPGRTTKQFGHPISVYELYPKGHAKSKVQNADHWEFWVASDLPLAAKVVAVTHDMNSWPKINFQPIYWVHIGGDGRRHVYLETTSVKRNSFAADWFQVPTTYRKTNNEMEVLMNMDGVTDMLDVMGDPDRRHK